jgi:WD40 repeat protein
LSGGWDNLHLWDVSSGKLRKTLDKRTSLVHSLALSADGRWALSGGWDKTPQLWEMSSGKCARTFKGHTNKVESVVLSADGRWALSGSLDKTVRLWELSSGNCIRVFRGHTNKVTSVALSADGRWALSGSADGTFRVWELEWDYEFPEQKDWDEGARPHLENFLTLHCAVKEGGLARVGKPTWSQEEFQELLLDLQYRGYGWLRSEGVRRQLGKMTAEWQGPPPMP